jgi:hypothetical protein
MVQISIKTKKSGHKSCTTLAVFFIQQAFNQGLGGHLPEILIATGTQSDQPGGLFIITNNDDVRPLQQAMFAYFIVYFLSTQITSSREGLLFSA